MAEIREAAGEGDAGDRWICIRRGEHFAVTRTDSGKGNRDKGGHNCWAQFAREIGDGSSEFPLAFSQSARYCRTPRRR